MPSKCENKFKVLERNYKKNKDNNNKTGRGRRVFEFENEMDEIFERKKNVNPTLLLSSECSDRAKSPLPQTFQETTVQVSVPDAQPGCSYSAPQHENREEKQSESEGETGMSQVEARTPKNLTLKRKRISSPAYQKRNDILLEMKNDFKKFYERRDKRQEEKLKIARQKLEESQKRTQIAKEYLEFMKQKGRNPED